jgi:hypothetical protein
MGLAQASQLVGWNHVAQDEIAFFQKLIAIDFHALLPRSLVG